jgi:alkanesulfonate monooxygenase SsuD/methylene tetrahydromethanopterin reductase-like flavin-dependent oxidoreductase (luciferase family)
MEISLHVSISMGITWPMWKRLLQIVDEAGFAGIYSSDHLIPPGLDALDTILALGYAADHTRRVHFGSLVSPVSYRHPAILTRQAVMLDHLSGGRMILGVGSGWVELEHTIFGLAFGDMKTRMDRFEEALFVITQLLRNDEPISYSGRFYQLQDALIGPRPLHAHSPKVLIGAKGARRTLPLTARFADIWNGDGLTVPEFKEASALLDDLLRKEGRQPQEVKRTVLVPVLFGDSPAELDAQIRALRFVDPGLPNSWEGALESLRSRRPSLIVGSADTVIAGLQEYADAGVEELIMNWRGLDAFEVLERFADQVLPQFAAVRS